MVNHALEEVVSEERSIQFRIDQEKRKAAEWLAREKERVARESEERLAAAAEECRKAIVRAESESTREVAEEVRKAEEYKKLLASLPDETLETCLGKHLPRILPEEKP